MIRGFFLSATQQIPPDRSGGSPAHHLPCRRFPGRTAPVFHAWDRHHLPMDHVVPCPGCQAALAFAGDIAAPASPPDPGPLLIFHFSEPFNHALSSCLPAQKPQTNNGHGQPAPTGNILGTHLHNNIFQGCFTLTCRDFCSFPASTARCKSQALDKNALNFVKVTAIIQLPSSFLEKASENKVPSFATGCFFDARLLGLRFSRRHHHSL